MCAQDLVAQKLEALRQEKALAAEMEQQLKDLNAQRAEVLNKQPSCYSATINLGDHCNAMVRFYDKKKYSRSALMSCRNK